MRSIINISLPKELTRKVETAVKCHHFSSKSEFFRHLLREWSAGRLAAELEEGKEEYRRGQARKLTSPKMLWR